MFLRRLKTNNIFFKQKTSSNKVLINFLDENIRFYIIFVKFHFNFNDTFHKYINRNKFKDSDKFAKIKLLKRLN